MRTVVLQTFSSQIVSVASSVSYLILHALYGNLLANGSSECQRIESLSDESGGSARFQHDFSAGSADVGAPCVVPEDKDPKSEKLGGDVVSWGLNTPKNDVVMGSTSWEVGILCIHGWETRLWWILAEVVSC